MQKNKKYSYWIISFICIIIIITIFPFKDVFSNRPKVGVVEINSPILNSKIIVENINYFNSKDQIKAIVIRLDTPGGGVAASQEIYQKVKKIADGNKKPIIASMGGIAASGGYYIALGADTIIANPGTTTGSIGVIMTYPVINELLDNIGIDYETVKSANLKDAGSIYRDLKEEERIYFQKLIDEMHDQFVQAVAIERNISYEDAFNLANGQVYSGRQAKNNGLVDMLGTFEDAVMLASKKAGYLVYPKVVYPPKKKKGLLELIIGDIFQSSSLANLLMYPKLEYRLQ